MPRILGNRTEELDIDEISLRRKALKKLFDEAYTRCVKSIEIDTDSNQAYARAINCMCVTAKDEGFRRNIIKGITQEDEFASFFTRGE